MIARLFHLRRQWIGQQRSIAWILLWSSDSRGRGHRKTIGARGSTESSLTVLEQMGEVCPTATVSAPEAHATTEGTWTAPSFIEISGSPSLTQSSATPQGNRTHAKTASGLHVFPPPFRQASIMASIRLLFRDQGFPLSQLVTQILAYQFTEMADLLPDNLGNPTSGTLFLYRRLLDCAHDKHAVAKEVWCSWYSDVGRVF